jgi:hypothetical protein
MKKAAVASMLITKILLVVEGMTAGVASEKNYFTAFLAPRARW